MALCTVAISEHYLAATQDTTCSDPSDANPLTSMESCSAMHRPIPTLAEYGLSADRGFLSPSEVMELSDPRFAEWEAAVSSIPVLLSGRKLRAVIDRLPLFDTTYLNSELQWKRAYFVLVVLVQGYIWEGESPVDRVPPLLTIPLLEVSDHVEVPPVATFSALCLSNYRCLGGGPLDAVDAISHLDCAFTFTGTDDERWFYIISVAIEAHGASTLPLMLKAMEEARAGDAATVTDCLCQLAHRMDRVVAILGRMHERCDPGIFYNRIRPLFAGSKGMEAAGLPYGVWYDTGTGHREYRQYAGISNAQSSLIQFFDICLGVEHRPTGVTKSSETLAVDRARPARHNFLEEMRQYMPGPHRRFLEHVSNVANIRQFVENRQADDALCTAYNGCLDQLRRLRDGHLSIVSRYIIVQSRKVENNAKLGNGTSTTLDAEKVTVKASQGEENQRGTGGTSLMPFLKQARDETIEPMIHI